MTVYGEIRQLERYSHHLQGSHMNFRLGEYVNFIQQSQASKVKWSDVKIQLVLMNGILK